MRADRRRPSLLAVGLATLVAVASVFAARQASREAVVAGHRSAEVAAGARANAISAELQGDDALLRSGAAGLTGNVSEAVAFAAFQSGDAGQSIGVARPSAGGGVVFTPILAGTDTRLAPLAHADLTTQPQWALAFQLARDDGTPAAAAADVDGRSIVLQVQGFYGSATPPLTVAERRNAIVEYLVILESGDSVTAADSEAPQQVAVRVTQGSLVVGGVAGGGSHPSTASVSADGVAWIVQAWWIQPASAGPLLILLIGLLVALAIGVAVAVRERSSRRVADDALATASELALVARVGSLLQQSLQLADLVPLFVDEISREFALGRVSIYVTSAAGRSERVFSIGGRSPDDTPTFATPVEACGPGAAIEVPLQRGGRIVGGLTAETTKGLRRSQMEALRSAGDLFAAALGNARILEEEQGMVSRLRELDQAKATFLGSVSHELRTSVIAIEGFAGLLGSARLEDAQRADFVERIARNARSLALLIEDLLDSARLERLGGPAQLQPVSLSDLVPTVVDQMSSILGHRPVSLTIAPRVVAAADPSAVERIVVNVLANAAKYTPDGTEVNITVAGADGDAIVEIADRGPGILPADRERIFDRFFRAASTADGPAPAARGIGIGLSLAKQYAELMHGSIVADEAPGGGALFRLRIPLAVAVDQDAELTHVGHG